MLKIIGALAALGAVILPLSAQKAKPEIVEQGRKEFEKSCGFCHGPDATGARGPDLIRSAVLSHDQNGEQLAPLIRNGRPDKGMPPLALGDAQIAQITAFLHARLAEALHSNKVSPDYPEEKLLTGDAGAGKSYFNGAGGCVACHSPTGDLAGVARKYSPLNLQARFLYPTGKRPTAIVTTASGQKAQRHGGAHGRVLGRPARFGRLVSFLAARRRQGGSARSAGRASQAALSIHGRDMHNLFAYLETLK